MKFKSATLLSWAANKSFLSFRCSRTIKYAALRVLKINHSRRTLANGAVSGILLATTALTLTACNMGPDYIKPLFGFEDNYQTKEQPFEKQGSVQEDWWKNFHDPILNDLIGSAVKQNRDIEVALANIEQERASRTSAASSWFPTLGVGASGKKSRSSTKLGTTFSSFNRENDNFAGDASVSWELDLFGKTRRAVEAADARLEAAYDAKRSVLLSTLADVAQSYFEVRGLQRQIDVTKRNIKLLKEIEKLAKAQFKAGLVTELDVSQARGERQSVEANLPGLQAQLQDGIYRLSVLCGQTPEYYSNLLLKNKPLPNVPDVIPVGLRSDILRNRPDIREAERNLAADTADIGVATAKLLPDVSLTGAAGTSARLFSDLFAGGAGTYTIGSALNWSLFKGGAMWADVDYSKAKTKAALATYQKTVLTALQEVESSLVLYGGEWKSLKQLKAAEKTRQKGFNIAKLRYEAGEESFLAMLDTERSLLSAQDARVQSEIKMLTRLVQVYKALGGGWQSFEEDAIGNKTGDKGDVVPVKDKHKVPKIPQPVIRPNVV